MSKFWLYLGILLACSVIGTCVGIFLIVLYVWTNIKESTNNKAVNNIDEKNHLWQECYDCIRTVYPET